MAPRRIHHPSMATSDHGSRTRGRSRVGDSLLRSRCSLCSPLVSDIRASWRVPDTAVPQPPSPSIEIDFSPTHPARSPIAVDVQLERDPPFPGGGGPTVTLAIYLTGTDLAHAGWSMFADVPAGVYVNGAVGNDPRTGRVSPFLDGRPKFTSTQVQCPAVCTRRCSNGTTSTVGRCGCKGHTWALALPDVTVENQTSADSNGTPSAPTPRVTVTQQLYPGGDFAFLGGLPPDHIDNGTWRWHPQLGHVNQGPAASSIQVEARSPSIDEQSSDHSFQAGIAFGVAAAAGIAAIQEFVNSGRRRKRESA